MTALHRDSRRRGERPGSFLAWPPPWGAELLGLGLLLKAPGAHDLPTQHRAVNSGSCYGCPRALREAGLCSSCELAPFVLQSTSHCYAARIA